MNLPYEEKDKYIYIKANRKKNYSLRKSIYFKTYNKTENKTLEAYPIKPFQNMIPKDINLQKIFSIQKTSSQYINKKYSFILDNNINENNRKKILFKIKEFIIRHHIDFKIFFKTIFLYDILLIENESQKLLSVEEVALGALVLSVKFNYIENKMISMKKFLELYDDKLYTLKHLFEIERRCLYMTKYYLNYITPMCFLEFFLINGIIFNTDSIKKDDYYKIYHKIEEVLTLIMEKSNNYLKYNFFHLACSIVSHVRKVFDLEKWPLPLKKTFGIEYFNFEQEYNSIFYKTSGFTNSENKKEIIIKGNNNTILLNFQDKNNTKSAKSNKSNFNLYQKQSDEINNKYCNNIINININNYSIGNNNINNYSYKKDSNPVQSLVRFSSGRNGVIDFNINRSMNEKQKQKESSEEKKYDIKIINRNLFRSIGKYDKDKDRVKTSYCSPQKKEKIKEYLKTKDIYDELEEENSKSNSKELKDEFNNTYRERKNYNFTSRFKLKLTKSTNNISSFIKEKNQINNSNSKSKIFELKNTVSEFNQIKPQIYDETPKKFSLYKNNQEIKNQIRNLNNKNYNTYIYVNKTEKKIIPVKRVITINAFETPYKSKETSKFSFKSNIKEKKENKTKIKAKYNNLIKYKLSISSSYKTKGFQ